MKLFPILGAGLIGGLTGPGLALTQASPRDDAPVLVVSLSPATLPDVIKDAQGRPIGAFTAPFAMFAASDTSEHGFADRLIDAGAFAVLDATTFAQICGATR